MANICIVEDDQNHAYALQEKVKAIGHTVLKISATFEEALLAIKTNKPDVILLDINLKNENDGIQLAHAIKSFSTIPIIYTTALIASDIIEKAVQIHPSGYLVKPIEKETLKATIELALQQQSQSISNAKEEVITQENTTFLTVRVGYKLRKINLKEIKFLKITSKNYVTLVDKDDKEFQLRNSLKALMKTLNSHFIQVHRLYGINLNYILHIDEKEQMLCLQERIHIPIGRTFKEDLYKKLNIM
ncbi:response regulator transcription factor [Kordia sp. YSTF-M3]|uniref:Response regulator transcription factor n=1 Tax=Kordia aestuariivivens TaxID=2759037 RepID=A0ABR7Q9Q6_9FLAO|nr:response regulator transcription factor [Kordia aestuariivivens]MBC8755285.1 response regulator transcription factor [Kordia aestuariivivens]